MEFDTSYTFTIPENETDNRIDRYLGQKLPDVSRTYIQKLIKEGFITINNKQVKPNYRLAANDMLSLTFPRPAAPDIVPENIPIDIIYEDEDIIVVNKPKTWLCIRRQVIIRVLLSMRLCTIAAIICQVLTVY